MFSALVSVILAINELMASNAGAVVNGEPVLSPAINFDSWIELYNPSDQAVSLAGFHLTDGKGNDWQMPSDIGNVPAKGFKVVWLGSNDIKTNQAPFKLDCDGGTISISDKNGTLISTVSYPKAMSRTSYARKTDGGDEWGWTDDATPGVTNATAKFSEKRLDAPVVNQGSQLFTSSLNVKVDIPEGATLLYTTDGSLPRIESPWKEMLTNGNCEGDDASCFVSRNGNGSGDVKRITDGAGINGSRGIKVHSVAGASNDYTTQFFVYTPNHIWKTNEKYRFRMMVRADKASKVNIQAHRTPGDYITGNMMSGSFNVTTEWKEFIYEGTVTKTQADEQTTGGGGGWWGGWQPTVTTYALQTIAFNLNDDKTTDNNFYFDEISWESYEEISSRESKDGNFAISSTTNFTFRLFKDGYLPSVPVTRSYIKTSNKYTLPIISIVGDKKYFTDPKIGFDTEGDGTNGKTGNGKDYPCNYNMDWDRPANFSYMSSDGKMLFNQDVNISVSGGWTRGQNYRSFKLKSNKIFDDQNRFDYAFFPQKPYIRNKVLLIRNGGNDVWTHGARFQDPALETIIQRSGLDVDVQSYVPVIEYVNGELRGVFNMREPNNDKFADANWGYDDEELDAFENLKMKNGTDEAINSIFELGRNATNDESYEKLKKLLDIDEFTNYMAVTMFLDNDDWPNNNIKAYRSRNDGRYRFISYDLDYAFALRGFSKDNDDPFKYFLRFKDADRVYDEGNQNREIVRLFLNLMGRDDYRRKFIDTFCLVGGSVFEPTRSNEIIDELRNNVKAMCQLMRQQGINDGHDPDRAASDIKSKLKGRSKKMAGHLKNFSYAKLSSNAQEVTLKTTTEGAKLYVNGLEVPYADFNGHLFAPVELHAVAPAGYYFVGWENGDQLYSTDEYINLPSDATVKLTAKFSPLSKEERQNFGITPVRINEVSANDGIYVTEYFKRKDWVELYNTTDEPIDVEGMYLTDNLEKPQKYQISKEATQTNTIIPAHGYLIIWCDKKDPTLTQLHATFNIEAEGDELQLMAADGSWKDTFKYPAHKFDQTVGRYPDGSNNIYLMNVPTIAKANISTSYLIEADDDAALGVSSVMASTTSEKAVYDLSGRRVPNDRTLSKGIYIINGKKVIIR